MATHGETAALIMAAGRGVRASTGNIPKQYQSVAGTPVLARTLQTFLDSPVVDRVRVVIGAGDEGLYAGIAPQHAKLDAPTVGGDTRQESVLRGLTTLDASPPQKILIHDGARPFVSDSLIARVANALEKAEAVTPALPVTDTLKHVDAAGRVTSTVPRDGLQAVSTPQGFRYQPILAAHRRAANAGVAFTDDAAVAEWAGMSVAVVVGDPANVKLTTAADLDAADRRLTAERALALGDIRVGIGYDVHALGPGVAVTLGGVAVPHSRGLIGHSDADVVLHAITDAILGALSEGDIGMHFPPSDPQWKGASSDRFLADAVARVSRRGGMISNVDVALTAEGPKIAPHRDAMRERIAAICGIAPNRVGIKATTNEGLGFIGRGEGMAATATATIRLPLS